MNNQQEKASGVALLSGSFLMVVTMVLHPVGGSLEHLWRVSTMIIIAHAIGIFSLPITLLGYRGLASKLHEAFFMSQLGKLFITFAMIAGMLAAAINGLALPMYINRYREAGPEVLENMKMILRYGTSLNHAFDYIMIGGMCLAILCWSIAILKTRVFPVWLGYLGILLSGTAVVMVLSGFYLVDLHGFRLFIFGVVAWTACAGVLMVRRRS